MIFLHAKLNNILNNIKYIHSKILLNISLHNSKNNKINIFYWALNLNINI